MRVTLSYLPRPLYPLNGVFVFSNILQCISISVSWLWRKYIATILCTKLREVTLIYVYRTTYESYEDNLKHWNTQALEFRTPLFPHLVPPAIMGLWYGSLSGSISLSHLSIFYNISWYNSLVLLTFVSRSSCRFT